MKTHLCIDGGGVRGLVPSVKLAELERRTGKQCYQMFDAISGTSTGGIIAAGLSLGMTAQSLVDMYWLRGKDIFHKPWPQTIRPIGLACDLFHAKYSAEGIEKVLKEVFKDSAMSDAKTELMIPAFDLDVDGPMFFHRRGHPDWLMRDVCRATSAAPSYFPLARLRNRRYWDGGMWANNPSSVYWADGLWPQDADEDMLTISLGTGTVMGTRMPEALEGLIDVAPHLINVFMAAQSQAAHVAMQAKSHTPVGQPGPTYIRIQSAVDNEAASMDDVTPGNLQWLVNFAMRDDQRLLDRVVEALAHRVQSSNV